MTMDPGGRGILEELASYTVNKLAPERIDSMAGDHWFDDVKVGFDTIWCAVARLELMLHCGKTSEEVGGPVLFDCKDADAIARELRKECPAFVGGGYGVLMKKKPPPGAPPWGSQP